MIASASLPSEHRSTATATAARFFYRQLFIRRPLALGLLVTPLSMLLLRVNPGAFLTCVFCLGSLPALGITLLPPHLPVPRRSLLLWSSLPAAAVLLVGFGASLATGPNGAFSTLVGGFAPPPFVLSAAEAPERAPAVALADDLWRLGEPDPDGVLLPDGTRVEPEQRSFGGLAVAHNPFTVPPDASLDQAALQVHRAIEACCDLQLSVPQVRAHLADGGPGSLESLQIAAAQRRRASYASISFYYLVLVLLILGWARLVLSFQPSAARAARSATARRSLAKWIVTGLVIALTFGFVSGVVASAANHNFFFAPRFFVAVLLRTWERHPLVGVALGGVVAFVLGRSLLRRYERLEVPLPKAAFSGHHA